MTRVLLFSVAAMLGSAAALFIPWSGDQAEPETRIAQISRAGSMTDNSDGTFTLILEDIRGIRWFSARPERSSGTVGISDFATSWETDEVQNSLLHAVLSVDENVYPMELVAMGFDATTTTFRFTVRQLEEDKTNVLEPSLLTDLEFESAVLSIDAYPTAAIREITN